MVHVPPASAVGLKLEVETWTDAHHPDPLTERRTRVQVSSPGGVTIALTGAGATLLIEADGNGTCTILRVTSDPDDEGIEVYSGSLGVT